MAAINESSREAPAEQNHPLHAIDRQTVDGLLAVEAPADQHLVDAARLLNRYDGFPGAPDLRDDLERVLRLWKLDRGALQARTRALWSAGYRPGAAQPGEAVGSGFDTAAGEGS
ncbi:MAG: DUF3288 family protein [Cyanobium sp.]